MNEVKRYCSTQLFCLVQFGIRPIVKIISIKIIGILYSDSKEEKKTSSNWKG